MTTQPELDLVNGLKTLTPVKQEDGELALEVCQTFNNPASKCRITKIELRSQPWSKKGRTTLSIWIDHKDKEKNSVIAQYAARHLDSMDGRMQEYRSQFPAIVKTLWANGQLDASKWQGKSRPTITLADMDTAKGFRWGQKAGCRCGCSPAFYVPQWVEEQLPLWVNHISVTLEEVEEVALAVNPDRLKSVTQNFPSLVGQQITA
jgi:hypothetical protein